MNELILAHKFGFYMGQTRAGTIYVDASIPPQEAQNKAMELAHESDDFKVWRFDRCCYEETAKILASNRRLFKAVVA